MEQSQEVLAYLRKKYNLNRSNLSPNQVQMLELFDPWINPDEGYIPYCQTCQQSYDAYKTHCGDVCEVEHKICLWYDYFHSKIIKLNPGVTIKIKK